MKPYLALIKRDLKLSLFHGSEGMTALFFFIVTASLFPFALGGAPETLQKAASGILWVTAALASLLSLEALYHRDEEDGTFDLLLLSPVSALGIAFAKIFTHWMVSGLPLVAASIVVSQMLFVPPGTLPVLILSLAMGTLYMSLLGGMGATLTFGAKRPGLLLTLLVLPLYVPMLILGVMGMEAALASLPEKPYLLLQLSLVVAALPLTAWMASLFLRMNLKS
jgi:heme exporter protein B